mmetsp:Transcript_8435/g.27924  ORF Transcript_8435/g.27924 Transcript_8435/m.27924 type:complete len:215 (-) Transcript_8435:1759-2403(-)
MSQRACALSAHATERRFVIANVLLSWCPSSRMTRCQKIRKSGVSMFVNSLDSRSRVMMTTSNSLANSRASNEAKSSTAVYRALVRTRTSCSSLMVSSSSSSLLSSTAPSSLLRRLSSTATRGAALDVPLAQNAICCNQCAMSTDGTTTSVALESHTRVGSSPPRLSTMRMASYNARLSKIKSSSDVPGGPYGIEFSNRAISGLRSNPSARNTGG